MLNCWEADTNLTSTADKGYNTQNDDSITSLNKFGTKVRDYNSAWPFYNWTLLQAYQRTSSMSAKLSKTLGGKGKSTKQATRQMLEQFKNDNFVLVCTYI